jgi:hypothetical protein
MVRMCSEVFSADQLRECVPVQCFRDCVRFEVLTGVLLKIASLLGFDIVSFDVWLLMFHPEDEGTVFL